MKNNGNYISALGRLTIGMSAETRVLVVRDMTIGHFVPAMPLVYATPIMIYATSNPSINSILT